MLTRGRAFSLLLPILCSVISGLTVFRTETCMVKESPLGTELRAEGKEERERELLNNEGRNGVDREALRVSS
jgi:hypothetical protein